MVLNEEVIQFLKSKDRSVFTTSFGMEDQVVLHLLRQHNIPCDVITLDTGRNFKETYEVWSRTERFFNLKIESVHPDAQALSALLKEQGPEGFYNSIENRKACCKVRKVTPLTQVLKNYSTWITGLRSDQTAHRNEMKMISYDDHFQVNKVSPVLDWSWNDINDYVQNYNIPVNRLHQKSYPSIGCEPCTRAVEAGEDFRAGRWWWENDHQECGLHLQETKQS